MAKKLGMKKQDMFDLFKEFDSVPPRVTHP